MCRDGVLVHSHQIVPNYELDDSQNGLRRDLRYYIRQYEDIPPIFPRGTLCKLVERSIFEEAWYYQLDKTTV